MRMKKYQATSMADAMAAIRAELGPNAVILHSSELKRGPLGLLSKPMVEVIAAADEAQIPRAVAKAAAVASRPAARPRTQPPRPAQMPSPAPAAARPTVAPQPPPVAAAPVESGALTEMQHQVRELRGALGRLVQHSQWPGMTKLAPPLADLYQRLLDQEVEPELAQSIVTTIDGELSLQAAADRATVMDSLLKHLRRMMPAAGALLPTPGQPTILFLVGPTGVGKTTTLAKLAANLAIDRHRVTLVTCDTFRIAAIPQLRTYADILRMPIEVAYTPDELTAKVVDHLDRDFILVDTPGRSQRNADQLHDLRRFVQAVPSRRTFLTISAGARYRDMLDVVARFGAIPFDGLLITKLDETTTVGPILNLVHQTKKPVTYLTDGQNVPQDIRIASSVGLAEMLIEACYAPSRAAPELIASGA